MSISDKEILKEREYLSNTKKVINEKISTLGQELYNKEEKIQEFQKFMWDSRHDMDPSELKTMEATSDLEVNMAMSKSKYFQKLFKIQGNPYFASIMFEDEESLKKIYIGITHLNDDTKHLIYDWRAPICSLFYDYEVGSASYKAPSGIIEGNLLNKRQFKIEHGELIRVFDNNLNIDDEMLQEVLAKSSSDKMKNIVNTIQQEQNEIIRNTDDKSLIVQGIAGSGKTSVALHRIAFLLYKIPNLSSNNVLIFSPNKVFSEYISNVLPELGEENTMQTTFHEFLESIITEYKKVESFTSFVERFYKYEEKNKELVKYKQSDDVIEDINNYLNNLMKKLEFNSGIENHDYEISKGELNQLLKDRYSKFNLYDRLDSISEKLCRDFYKGKKTKKSSIKSDLIKRLNIDYNYVNIYKEFFNSEFFINNYKGNICDSDINILNKKEILKYEDACLFVYMKSILEGFSYRGKIDEVVIDEAQDYSKLQYLIMKNIFKRSGFTILGDVNQTINPYYKYETLEILNDIYEDSKYIELNKTYRSSEEIIDYTNKILKLNHVSAIRNSNNRPVLFRNEENNLLELLKTDIDNLKTSNMSIAIITKDDSESEKIYNILKSIYNDINIVSSNSVDFNKKFIVIPSYIAKGLEFDSTIIYTSKNNKYTEEEKYLFYVACTRSQHQLIIYNQN